MQNNTPLSNMFNKLKNNTVIKNYEQHRRRIPRHFRKRLRIASVDAEISPVA